MLHLIYAAIKLWLHDSWADFLLRRKRSIGVGPLLIHNFRCRYHVNNYLTYIGLCPLLLLATIR